MRDTPDTSRAVWEAVWRQGGQPAEWDYLSEEVWRFLCRALPASSGLSVLQAGCGSGRISLHLAHAGACVTMIDLAPAALAIARRFFRQGEADCRLVQGDIAHLPFGEARFDVVWSAGVLEHFDTRGRKQVLGEMVRVCRPGGRVVTIVPYARALLDTLAKRRAERLGVWPWGYEEPLSTLREEYAEAGLRWVEESCLAMRQDLRFAEEFLTRRRWALWVLDELLYRVLRPLGRAGYLLGAIGVKEEEAGAWVPPEA